jgi:DNA-binding SARP family transcriptional activator
MGAEANPTVTLSLLRGFALRVGDDPVPLTWSAQRLVAFLALQDRPLARTYVAGVLWPDTPSIRAAANLRSALWRAQRSCGRLILASTQQLALAPDVVVDLRGIVSHANRLLGGAGRCDDALDTVTRLSLSADLLPDWYDDDWVLIEREQYHQLRMHALEAMCERLIAGERYGEAVAAGLAAVRAEPLRESAQRALIRAHLAEGNRWEALQQYEHYRLLLHGELGVEPSPALCELLQPRHQEQLRVAR